MKKQQGILKYVIYTVLIVALTLLLIPSIFSNLKYGLDLQGGFEVLYKVSSLNEDEELTEDMLKNTYKNLLRRIDNLGVAEPVITIEGEDKIRVQLAGITDQEEAREVLSKPAVLTFRDANDNLLMTSEVLSSKGASVGQSSNGLPAVALGISKKDEFYRVTSKISKTEDKLMVVWLDFEEGTDSYKTEKATCGTDTSNCLSAATVSEGFSSDVVIQGNFTTDEVKKLVDFINSGNLPTKLEEISSKTVGASFGANSLDKTFFAGIVGIALVMILMVVLYRFAGFISAVGLLIYTVITFGIFWLVGGVLTLPGIAAMLLGIGMAVDANVLNFARIKDELRNGVSLETAFKKGNTNSLKTIIDANVTTLLVAVILFIFGESSIKGFATMLMISIFVTMVVMVVITRLLLKRFVNTGYFNDKVNLFVGKVKDKKQKIDYVKHSKLIFIITGICILVGIISLFVNGLNLGVDFKGGTVISIDANITEKQIKDELKDYEITSIENSNPISVRVDQNLTKDEINTIKNKFEQDYKASTDIDVVSNIVKMELIKNAVYSVILAVIGIIIYVTFRFKFSFGVSSIIALIHDAFMMIAVFSLLKLEVSTIFIAAILTIIGYSINDTIVIFDRIRENMHKKQIKSEDDLKEIVNKSVNETLIRNIVTFTTTFVPVLCLIIFGSKEILNFNVALLIGLIAGLYSSLLIASQIWLKLEKKNIGKTNQKKWYEDDKPEEKKIKGINS